MFEAQILKIGMKVYGPWMERGGDNLIATVDLVDNGASGSVIVRLFSKNKDDTGDGTEVDSGTKINTNSIGRTAATWTPSTGTGIKQMVRYKFECSTVPNSWILFRMLSPVWFDTIDAS